MKSFIIQNDLPNIEREKSLFLHSDGAILNQIILCLKDVSSTWSPVIKKVNDNMRKIESILLTSDSVRQSFLMDV